MKLMVVHALVGLTILISQQVTFAGGGSHGTHWGKFKIAQLKMLNPEQQKALAEREAVVATYMRTELQNHARSFFAVPERRSFENPKSQKIYDYLLQNGIRSRLRRGVPLVSSEACEQIFIENGVARRISQPATAKLAPEDGICMNPKLIALLSFDSLLATSSQDLRPLTFGVYLHELTRYYDQGDFELDGDHDFLIDMIREAQVATLVADTRCLGQQAFCALTTVTSDANRPATAYVWDSSKSKKISLEVSVSRADVASEPCFQGLSVNGQTAKANKIGSRNAKGKVDKKAPLVAGFPINLLDLNGAPVEILSQFDQHWDKQFRKTGKPSKTIASAQVISNISDWRFVMDLPMLMCPPILVKVSDENGRILVDAQVPRRRLETDSSNFAGTSDPAGEIDPRTFFVEPYRPLKMIFVPIDRVLNGIQ